MSREPLDWPLIRRLARIVHNDPCGGIHRDALAERLHLPPRGRCMAGALGIAYRNKKIDFCGQYVVKPAVRRIDVRPEQSGRQQEKEDQHDRTQDTVRG